MQQLRFFRGHFARSSGFALAALIPATVVLAQANTGQLSGTVTDPTGAVISSAQISLTDAANGFSRMTKSDGSGNYIVNGLPIGTYTVEVTAPGFSSYKVQATVNVGGHATIDAKLTTGGNTTTIQVATQDDATQVNTTNSEISQVIDSKQLTDLPSLTRDPYDFVELSGNVTADPNGSTGRGVDVSLGGQRAASTEILLDGVENADNYDAYVGLAVPLDSVAQYRVITNGFDAQYGRASGGVVNLVTKSGTNSFHGSLYEFNRVSDLAANTYNEDALDYANRAQGLPNNPADHFTRNQFGYSVGGPILRDKLFFFSNTEWNRIRSAGSKVYEIPSASFLATAAPATQAYFQSFGTVAASTRLGATIPVSGYTGANPLQLATVNAPFDAGAGSPENQWSTLNRFDYTLNQSSACISALATLRMRSPLATTR